MTPALDALVTDADVEHFLQELASVATGGARGGGGHRARRGAREVARGGGGDVGGDRDGGGRRDYRGERRGETRESDDARRRAGVDAATAAATASGWIVLAPRELRGNGTTYRLLKRNGPAPGTASEGRRGLTQFRLEMVMEGVSAEQLTRVQMNDVIRGEWDTSLVAAGHLARSDAETYDVSTDMSSITDAEDNDAGEGSELAFWRMKFPAPLAPRDYLFVRRRWRCADGAYYGVTKDATGSRDGDALLGSLRRGTARPACDASSRGSASATPLAADPPRVREDEPDAARVRRPRTPPRAASGGIPRFYENGFRADRRYGAAELSSCTTKTRASPRL